MASVVIDSNILIAARLASDQNHESGTAIANGIDTGSLPPARIPDDVLAEVLNYLHTRTGNNVATETLDGVLSAANFEVVRTAESDFQTGRSLFRQYEGLSFTDAVLCAYAERSGTEYLYSFDDDFDAVEGLIRLETDDNPFPD